MSRPFKYQQYLSKYNNCPSPDCTEKDKICYRWVHKVVNEKDFIPTQLHPDIPPRRLDSSDSQCIGHGLSLFEDLISARDSYLHHYNHRSRPNLKEKFILEKGANIAELNITKEDGVQNEPNNITKHITFYEYEGCAFLNKINGTFDIFA